MKKRTIAIALLAAVLLATVAFADDKPIARHDDKTPVHFSSSPDSADLYIDGNFVGSTEVVYRLAPGVHEIEIRLDNYESWHRQLTVTAGNPTRVAARLKPQK